MKYLLDTNVCIQYLNGRSESIKREMELHQASQEIVLCSIVRAELRYGALKSRNPHKTLAKQQRFIDYFHSLPLMIVRLDFIVIFVLVWKNKAYQ